MKRIQVEESGITTCTGSTWLPCGGARCWLEVGSDWEMSVERYSILEKRVIISIIIRCIWVKEFFGTGVNYGNGRQGLSVVGGIKVGET